MELFLVLLDFSVHIFNSSDILEFLFFPKNQVYLML